MKALYKENYPEEVLSFEEHTDLASFIWTDFPQIKKFYKKGATYLQEIFSTVLPRICWRHSPGRVILSLQYKTDSFNGDLGLKFLHSIGLWRARKELIQQDPATDLHTLFPYFLFGFGGSLALNSPIKTRSLEERRSCTLIKDLESLSLERSRVRAKIPSHGQENWDEEEVGSAAHPRIKHKFLMKAKSSRFTTTLPEPNWDLLEEDWY